MAAWRKENPKIADIHNDRIMRFRSDVHQIMRTIGVERKLPRSYSTLAECQAKAKAVFAGSRILPGRALSGTTAPENIMRFGGTESIFKIGSEDSLIEGTLTEPRGSDDGVASLSPDGFASMPEDSPISSEAVPTDPPTRTRRAKPKPIPEMTAPAFGRPKNVKELE